MDYFGHQVVFDLNTWKDEAASQFREFLFACFQGMLLYGLKHLVSAVAPNAITFFHAADHEEVNRNVEVVGSVKNLQRNLP